VVVTIIGMLTAMVFGALQMSRKTAMEAKTKATIAKLNNIIMRRYESYMTRRVPISTSGLNPTAAAQNRLYALRDLMRMEMPDRLADITIGPITLPNSGTSATTKSVQRPALSQLYKSYCESHTPDESVGDGCAAAEMLYLTVNLGSPEAMEQFNQSEIGDTDQNGYLEFLDGWGRPIFWLRWAPGYSQYSDIQVTDPVNNHDPFDPRGVDDLAYHLIPLIYSEGSTAGDKDHGIHANPPDPPSSGYSFGTAGGDMFGNDDFKKIGTLLGITSFGGITNHHIEQR